MTSISSQVRDPEDVEHHEVVQKDHLDFRWAQMEDSLARASCRRIDRVTRGYGVQS